MKGQVALIKEEGVEFAVVVVKPTATTSTSTASRQIDALSPHFGGLPVVLMSQNARGVPTYVGRHDLVKFLATVPVEALPFRSFSLN